jgi:hypothetical protein
VSGHFPIVSTFWARISDFGTLPTQYKIVQKWSISGKLGQFPKNCRKLSKILSKKGDTSHPVGHFPRKCPKIFALDTSHPADTSPSLRRRGGEVPGTSLIVPKFYPPKPLKLALSNLCRFIGTFQSVLYLIKSNHKNYENECFHQ